MEKIHFTVILSALVICFNMQIRGNYGITAQHFVFNGSSYKFHASSKHGQNWGESRGACKETGSDLVSIESLEEWVFLNNTIQTMKTGEYFIGLKKNVKSREWRWISDNSKLDATKGTFPWATSQPSGDKDGYCVVMYKNYLQDYGKYNDVSCKAKFQDKGYICESHNESNGKDGPTVKGTSQTNRVNKERATKPTTRQSSTVTSATRLTLSIRPLKEANSEGLTVKRTSQTEGGSTEPATKPTTMQSFLVTAVLPRSPLTKVNSEATTARNTVENLPSEHTASNSSNLIVIVLTLLAFLILIILIIFCVISIRRRRNFKNQVKSRVRCSYKKPPSPGQQSDGEHTQHLESSAELTVHVTLSRTEAGLDTYETVNDCNEERTYANVEKRSKMSKSDREGTFTRKEGTEMQIRSGDGYCIPLDNSSKLDAAKKPETHGVVDVENEKQKENKDHIYKDSLAKVSRASFHAKARCSLRDGTSLETVNRPSSLQPMSRGLDSYETVNDCKEESTYEAVENSNRKSTSDKGKSFTREEAKKQMRSDDGYFIPVDNSPKVNATKKLETHGVVEAKIEKEEENKGHVYAVVHKDSPGKVSRASFHAKARCSLQGDTSVNRSSSVTPVSRLSSVQSDHRSTSVNPVKRSSSAIETELNTNKTAADEDAVAGEEKKEYLYAAVDKVSKKRRPLQMPPPYRGLVYADLSHSPTNNTKPVKRGFPTIYADIDPLKTVSASLKTPEENLDQATKDDAPEQ